MSSPTTRLALPVLIALGCTHLLNDLLQSVVAASYPILKADLGLTFGQIGLITLVYQAAASIFQPVVGLCFDRHPLPWSLPVAATLTMCGVLLLSFAGALPGVLLAVFVIGLGSSMVHPEASRIASLASGGRRGLAQSLFQVGGNLGTSAGPLLVAVVLDGEHRARMAWFVVFSLLAYAAAVPVCRWFRTYLAEMRTTHATMRVRDERPLSVGMTLAALGVLTVLIFSKYIYLASLTSYYTFYLIGKFGVSIQLSQVLLFVFLLATALGTVVGGPLGDRIGRKAVIWISILGAAPFSLLLPHVGLWATAVLSFCAGFVLSSAFPAILLYAQELLPYRLGLVSGLFFGFAFGVAGIASAVLGGLADLYGIDAIYHACAYMPLLGLAAALLPDLRRR